MKQSPDMAGSLKPGADGGAAFFAITVPGLAVNCVAVFITLKVAKNQALPPNIFLSSLACIDFFGLVIVTLPTMLAYSLGDWVGGAGLCLAQGLAALFCVAASGLVAVLLATDRALAVMKPFWYRSHRRRRALVSGCCVAVLALSACLTLLLPLIKVHAIITRRYPGTYCSFTSFSPEPEVRGFALVFCSFCLTCCVAVVALNLLVAAGMRMRRRIAQRLMCKHICGQQRLDSERQHARSMAAVSLLHMICWVPFLVRIYCAHTNSHVFTICRVLCTCLCCSLSVVVHCVRIVHVGSPSVLFTVCVLFHLQPGQNVCDTLPFIAIFAPFPLPSDATLDDCSGTNIAWWEGGKVGLAERTFVSM